jgi:serine-type D-Ala-D-Ala carboxypeptidase (penicillin-binding protein 5/6)
MDNFDPIKYITNKETEITEPRKVEVFWPLLLWSLLAIILLVLSLFLIKPLKTSLINQRDLLPSSFQDQKVASANKKTDNSFPEVNIEAKAGYIFDTQSKKILYQKNATEQLPLASITKVMAAVVALDIVPPMTTVEITPASLVIEGNHDLVAGEKWTLRDLIKYSLTISSNNGMNAIASAIGAFEGNGSNNTDLDSQNFVGTMNQYAEKIGLYNTKFFNETGLDINGNVSGAYSTAEDAAKLLSYAIQKQPDVFESTTKESFEAKSLSNIRHFTINTNEVAGQIPGLIGSKTGYTDLAGGNLVIAFDVDLNHPIIVSVLGSSREGRFSDILKLVKATQKYFSN